MVWFTCDSDHGQFITVLFQGGTETVQTLHDSGEPRQSRSDPNGTEPNRSDLV